MLLGDDPIEPRVRQLAAGGGFAVTATEVWLLVRPPGTTLAPHGWKLHVSARPLNFAAIVDRLVPFLLDRQLVFKLARSRRVLMQINSGNESPAAVGKAFTIYPPPDRVTELGHAIARLLAGVAGPQVPSDRRISPNAPVYYRYGPFHGSSQLDQHGALVAELHGPDGALFSGMATPFYRQPDWAPDPFQEGVEPPATDQEPVLGGRYRITAGVQHHVRGSVFRAERSQDLASVIVKLAHAYIAEDEEHYDARLRLRNERRILTMLAGIDGVPAFLDHLRSGHTELLVTTDQGPANLVQDVADHGCYPATGSRRSIGRLAAELAGIVAAIHRRGVLVRDISPKNIVLNRARPSIVDFGIAAADGIAPIGRTPGYASPGQQRGEPPAAADDCYALGMTLLFALTGVDPVAVGDDAGWTRVRALELLELHAESVVNGVPAAIADLLSEDPGVAAQMLDRLASRPPQWPVAPASPLPRTPPVNVDLAGEITDFLVDQLLERAKQVLADPETRSGRCDSGVHGGLSGIGLQLLHHREHPGCLDVLSDLVELIATAPLAKGPPGLFLGPAGIRIFLTAAHRLGVSTDGQDQWSACNDEDPTGPDLMTGAAGQGVERLRMFQLCGDPRTLERARTLARLLLEPAGFPEETEVSLPRIGVDPAAGLAHGRAGTVYLLTALTTVDDSFRPEASRHAGALANEVPDLVAGAQQPSARPLAASWCQGLAGVARVLHSCGQILDEPELTGAAIQASEACLNWVPRMATIGQCCGLAGVGSMLLNLALARRSAGRSDGLELVAGQLLRRSSGPVGRPVFRAGSHDTSWGYGTAGALAFFRSMRDGAIGGTLETDAYSALFLSEAVPI